MKLEDSSFFYILDTTFQKYRGKMWTKALMYIKTIIEKPKNSKATKVKYMVFSVL